MTKTPWHPLHVITPAIAQGLMEIEAVRAVVDETPLPLADEAKASPPGPFHAAYMSVIVSELPTLPERSGVMAN